jgi:hypothetical protein
MWAHYAQLHTGFVIGFKSRDPLLSDLREVTYTSLPPVVESDLSTAIYAKLSDWEYEREWRSIRVRSHKPPTQTRDGNIHLYRFEPDAVAEVIVGHRMCASDKLDIQKLQADSRYRHVEFFESVPDSETWSLKKRRLR